MVKTAKLPIESSGAATAARYEIVGEIGRGATGTVYQAYDHALFRMIALKVLDSGVDPVGRKSFERERAALARLHHENIVTLFDCRPRADKPFMALSFLSGPSLKDVLESGSLGGPHAAAVAYELSRALEHVHGSGFIYRDVKPENVIIQDERIVLIDFGTAVEIGIDDPDGEVAGTLGFMAPEQYEGRQVDHRCDVFGLGALIYETLVGTTPYGVFAKRRRCIRPHRYVHPNEARPELPNALADTVHQCLQLDPGERFWSMNGIQESLRNVFRTYGIIDPRSVLRDLTEAGS